MAAHIDTMFKLLMPTVCNDKVTEEFKNTISNVVAHPAKLNDMPAFVDLFYRDTFNFDGLQKETGIDFKILKACVQSKHHTVKDFLHEVLNNNKDIQDIETIIQVGTNDGIGLSEITFHLDEDKLNVLKLQGIGGDMDFE